MMLYWNTKNANDTYEKKISDAKNRVKQQTISEPAKQKKRSERTDR